MRLAFVLFNWFPHGGLQKDLVKVVRACQAHAQIAVYTMSWSGDRLPGVTTVIVPVSGWTATARRASFARYVASDVGPQHDRVIGFNRMPALDVYFAADTCFAERAFRQHGWWYRQTPRARQYLAFERAVFATTASARALLLSPQQRREYQRWYHTPDARLVDLPPGISRDHRAGSDAADMRTALRQEFGIGNDELLVLQVGSGFKTKGVERSLLALAALPEPLRIKTRYILVGHDRPDSWLARAARLGLGQQVRILPPRDDIRRFMQGADLLLHPSRNESAGMVLLEAIVAGLPVLTTANCGYAFHVHKAQAGVVCEEPFVQAALNRQLQAMLETDRHGWRENGIRYGQHEALYDMPQAAAAAILAPGELC